MTDYLLQYLLSYGLPIILAIIWYKFYKRKYTPAVAIINLIFINVATLLLLDKYKTNSILTGTLLTFQAIFFIMLAVYLITYAGARGKKIGFLSAEWAIIRLLGHPVIIYSVIFFLSLYADYGINILKYLGIS
jgi:hypothetical protein